MGLIYRIRAIIIQFREKIAKTTERRSPGNNSRRIAAKGQTLQPKGEMQMTKLGYQPKILLPDGEFFRFEIIWADIEDSEYGYQLGLELKTLGGKHAGHTFKDWSKISGDEDDGLFIKEGSKAEELVKAVLGTDMPTSRTSTRTRSRAGVSWPAWPSHRTASATVSSSAPSGVFLPRIPKMTSTTFLSST